MHKLTYKAVLQSCLFFCLTLAGINSHAAILIDNFTTFQSVSDNGVAPGASNGPLALVAPATQLINAQRTLTADATGGAFGDTTILIGEPGGPGTGGVLSVANNSFSAGTTTLRYSFDLADFTAAANAILLEIITVDLGVNVEMIVNGTSSSGVRAFPAGSGNFFVNFADFTDPAAFASATALDLVFTGPQAWDGQFRLLAAQNVPEPGVLILMSLGLIGLGVSKKGFHKG